jgi:c-di-GMP-related signal transduction protein
MDLYIARQPIFDRKMRVYGYELLYRSGMDNVYDGSDDNKSTAELINNTFLAMQSDKVTGKSKAFINFSKDMLLQNIPKILPAETTVVEILESVEIDDEVVETCKQLAKDGYTIALDDFVFDESYTPLLEIAHIIKIEFNRVDLDEQRELIKKYRRRIKFLAEKVETREEYQLAYDMGYHYFQGYFFSKPIIMKDREIGALNANLVMVMNLLDKGDAEFNEIAKIIEMDLDLSYKLLKLSSSAFYGLKTSIVKHALVQIGLIELRRWIYILLLKDVQIVENREMIKNSFVRAKFMEVLASEIGADAKKSEYFMAGMFSSLDTLLGKPMKEIIEEISLPKTAKDALLGKENSIKRALDIVLSYELLKWDELDEDIKNFEIEAGRLREIYLDALVWAMSLEY